MAVMEMAVEFNHPETKKRPMAVRPPGGFSNLLNKLYADAP
jgi:hypothetical protein